LGQGGFLLKKFLKEGKIMKKIALLFVVLTFLVFSLTGVAYSWQGRMAGMGDPFGLIPDESDFLIHPAGIADGEGVNFYGNYRFNYTDVMDWNYTLKRFNSVTGAFFAREPFRGSGNEQDHDGLAGAAFPLGPGRMGLFLEYKGRRGDFDGPENEVDTGISYFHRFSLDSDLDAFALRLLYGLPMGSLKLGSEIQLAYRREENETFFNEDFSGGARQLLKNLPTGTLLPWENLFQYMFPYDSKYWEVLFKESLKGVIGPAKVAFTVRGGFIFAGDNKLKYTNASDIFGSESVNMDGDVKGWRIGSDLWLRFPLAKGLSVPMLVKVDYQKKTRDGDGPGNAVTGFGGTFFDYKNREKSLQIEAGGGVDKELNKGTRIAAGVYYNYFKNKSDFLFTIDNSSFTDHTNYPDQREHKVMLKLAGEKEISPMFAMRMGLNLFYGWVNEDLKFNSNMITSTENLSLDGSHWGIEASLGGTVKVQRFSIEPFLAGGYQKLDLDGDGIRTGFAFLSEVDKLKKEWSVGGGFSIRF
jgi:hypothetical protein